jgi:hypothetical protein
MRFCVILHGSMACADPAAKRLQRGETKPVIRDLLGGCQSTWMKGMTPMDQTQVEALEQKHAQLEALIDEEEHRPHPDDIRLHELKKAKLRVKDELVGH